jgi:hypothetical protein
LEARLFDQGFPQGSQFSQNGIGSVGLGPDIDMNLFDTFIMGACEPILDEALKGGVLIEERMKARFVLINLKASFHR